MKNKLTLLTAVLLLSIVAFAQAPQKINYQAVARNLAGAPLVNSPVSLLFEIRQGSPTGTVVYSETHASAMTNQFGLFNVEIGGGAPVSGTFAGINWSTGLYYLYIEVNGTPMLPATQLLSVPYALHANTATSGTPGANGHNGLTAVTIEAPGVNCTNGGYLVDVGADDNDDGTLQSLEIDLSYYVCNGLDGASNSNDTSATNEIQALSISNDTIFLSNGGFVVLPPALGDDWGVQSVVTDATLSGNGTSGNPLSGFDGNYNNLTNQPTIPTNVSQLTNDAGYITNPNDGDTSTTNEIQVLTISNDTIYLSSGGYVVLPPVVGDDWGSQSVVTDATLSGNGTSGNPLSGFDGNYNNLTNQPTIPTNVSQLTNDAGYITSPNDGDTDPTNEIELPSTASTNDVLVWNGSAWVAMSPSFINTDNQDLSLTGNTLSLTNDATPVDLSPYMDNTDAQTLSYNSGTQSLAISNGNSVTLVVDDADNDPANENNTAFGVTGGNLQITDAGGTLSVPLSSLSDGDWTVVGNDLTTSSTAANVGIGVFSGAPNLLGLTTNALTISSSASYQFGKSASLELVGSSNAAGNTMGQIDFIGIGAGPSINNIARIEGEATGGVTTGELVFYTNDGLGLTEKMRLDRNGYLGLGTNNPLQMLHVNNGVFRLSDASDNFDISQTGTQTQFTISNPLAIAPNGAGVKFTMDDGNADFFVQVSIQDGTQGLNRVLTSNASGYATWMDLSAISPGATAWSKTGTSIYPTVLTDFVGIGTVTPATQLDVSTTTTERAGQFNSNYASNNDKYGIYTLAQGGGTGNNYGIQGEAINATTNIGVRGRAFGGSSNYSGYFDLGDFYIADNLGIGTATPTSKLHVEGNTYINGATAIGGAIGGLSATFKVYSGFGAGTAYFFDGGGASSLSVLSSGDVVIGGTTGVGKLLVQATDANATGASGSHINIQNKANATGTTAGIRFRTGGSTGINGDFHYKGAIFFEDNTGTNGEGDMIFAVNGVANSTNATTADEAMKITSAGHVAIGNGYTGATFNVDQSNIPYSLYCRNTYTSASSYSGLFYNTGASSSNKYGVYAYVQSGSGSNDYGIYDYTSSSATTAKAAHIQVYAASSSTTAYGVYAASGGVGGSTYYSVYSSGPQASTTSSTWTFVSDRRMKNNISDLNINALETLLKLKPKSYIYKYEEYPQMNLPKTQQWGFVAQEVEEVIPEMVRKIVHPAETDKDGNIVSPEITLKGLNYDRLFPLLVKAVQEQQQMIEDLKKEIEELKNK